MLARISLRSLIVARTRVNTCIQKRFYPIDIDKVQNLLQTGLYDQVIQRCNNVLASENNDFNVNIAHMYKAVALFQTGKFDESIDNAFKVLESDPTNVAMLDVIMRSLNDKGKLRERDVIAKRIMKIDPAHSQALDYLTEKKAT
jgi:tetratricopeptide (TPR) repeat protein